MPERTTNPAAAGLDRRHARHHYHHEHTAHAVIDHGPAMTPHLQKAPASIRPTCMEIDRSPAARAAPSPPRNSCGERADAIQAQVATNADQHPAAAGINLSIATALWRDSRRPPMRGDQPTVDHGE